MTEPEILEIFRIVKPLSSVLVNIEAALKESPDMSLGEFCSAQASHPMNLLYSKGFSGLLAMAALVPIKQALESNKDDTFKESPLRHARNALCHGTIEFKPTNKIKFTDYTKTVELSPKEIIDLAAKAWSQYAATK
ncbi:hypothetical protein EZJ19_11320 [Parasulfuritortus cantonensis]|uniref:Uncharacterized protein n=1 Tax=Parasulfuritortus cantonensis TaxID=2528202 RepID=A0A4R1B413_9PROT|nr:hypothetical protein [Parasulfuritortus cantonensis]TCJ12822.1 hypothetical protein EZJ19_11320 [Parasulfuritortus cantonensis]